MILIFNSTSHCQATTTDVFTPFDKHILHIVELTRGGEMKRKISPLKSFLKSLDDGLSTAILFLFLLFLFFLFLFYLPFHLFIILLFLIFLGFLFLLSTKAWEMHLKRGEKEVSAIMSEKTVCLWNAALRRWCELFVCKTKKGHAKGNFWASLAVIWKRNTFSPTPNFLQKMRESSKTIEKSEIFSSIPIRHSHVHSFWHPPSCCLHILLSFEVLFLFLPCLKCLSFLSNFSWWVSLTFSIHSCSWRFRDSADGSKRVFSQFLAFFELFGTVSFFLLDWAFFLLSFLRLSSSPSLSLVVSRLFFFFFSYRVRGRTIPGKLSPALMM